MTMVIQTKYTCRCGKKRDIPKYPTELFCGCGRTITVKEGKVTIKDKKK